MAQITLLTVGSRGDIQPFCAIAHALIQRGHTVTLAASFNFANFAAQQHIPFAPIAGDFKQILGSPAGIDLLEGDTSVTLIEDDLLWQQLTESWEACQGCDLLIFSPLSLWGYHIAEALKVPAILATAVPVAATAEFPFLQFTKRTQSRLSGLLNQLSYRLVSTLGWRRSANLINRFRTEALHLRKLPWPGALYRKEKPPFLSPLPLVHCYSESVIPPAADWGSSVHQAGYCFLETAKSFSPSPALKAFLEKSPQPFYIGFGSMIARNPKQLAKTILSALADTGQRAILCSGWGNIQQEDLSDSVYLLEKVPHDWLFPQVAGAIHHGGAGTTAATLKAGIPSIVIPFFADQPIWGKRLEQLGVSPATHPQSALSSEVLARSIRAIVTDDSYRAQAKAIQTKIQAENGVARVVAIAESYLVTAVDA
ncbi:MAG: glycosyltransferase [Phormidesmis sp.]